MSYVFSMSYSSWKQLKAGQNSPNRALLTKGNTTIWGVGVMSRL